MIVALVVVLLVSVSSCASSFAARKQGQLAAPSSVDFGSITVGSSSTQSLTVTNMGPSNTTISGATVTGSGFSFKGLALPFNLQPGQSTSFSVSFLPSAPGSAQGSLSLSSKQNSVTVALGGTGVQPSISIAPGSVSFGNVPVGVTSSQTITLSNPGNATLDITQFTAPNAGFSMLYAWNGRKPGKQRYTLQQCADITCEALAFGLRCSAAAADLGAAGQPSIRQCQRGK
jgi:hypothetical protein